MGQLASHCNQGRIDKHTFGVRPGQGFFVLLPCFNAVINIGHDLGRKDHRHDFAHAGNKQGGHIKYIQGCIEIVLEAVKQ